MPISQKSKSFSLPENPFEKVHGHTKIELTDIKSGKKKIIEHDNDFQSGVLASYMRSMGAFNNNPYANSTWAGQPIWRNLCGGVFCFRDAIDNSEDEIEYMPAGNQMTANGAYGVTNSGTPVEMGSYNSIESRTDGSDSVTFVYDYNTSQGNGTIACVCLTTEIGGYIGYGNPSGERHTTTKAINANQSSNSLSGIVYDNHRWAFSVNTSTKEVTVTKTPTEVSKGSIFDNIAEDASVYTYTTAITGSSLVIKDLGNGKVAIFGVTAQSDSAREWEANATMNYLLFDMATETLTEKTLTNTSGVTLTLTNYATRVFDATGDYFIFPTPSNDFARPKEPRYAISMTTGTAIMLTTGTAQAGSQEFSFSYPQNRLADDLTLLSTYGGAYIADMASGNAYPANTSNINLWQSADLGAMTNGTQIFKNPLILSTINNLDTPVTKTAAQTMKITYTLSKASE